MKGLLTTLIFIFAVDALIGVRRRGRAQHSGCL